MKIALVSLFSRVGGCCPLALISRISKSVKH